MALYATPRDLRCLKRTESVGLANGRATGCSARGNGLHAGTGARRLGCVTEGGEGVGFRPERTSSSYWIVSAHLDRAQELVPRPPGSPAMLP